MSIFLYLAVLTTALYWVSKLLLPEMAKPPVSTALPELKSFDVSGSDDFDNRIKKMEILLAEKNKNISFLQAELKIFYVQVRDSDKIKALLEEEIHRLKEQNRIFRSELGMSPIPSLHGTISAAESSERLFI